MKNSSLTCVKLCTIIETCSISFGCWPCTSICISGNKKCILLSHDWGGAIAWILAAKSPHLLNKVVIMNCPQPSAMVKFARRSWQQFMKSWYVNVYSIIYIYTIVQDFQFGILDKKFFRIDTACFKVHGTLSRIVKLGSAE